MGTVRNFRRKGLSAEDRSLLRTIYLLAWPAILEQLLQTIVQYTDTAMVGRISPQASAAIGLTTTMTWLVGSPMGALGIGVLSCIAESIGAHREELAGSIAVQALYFVAGIGILLGALTLSVSPFLPSWLGADPEIRHDASLYFAIICAPMVFRASTIILGAALRGSGDTRHPMYANVMMNITNVVLNFFLIYDPRVVTVGSRSLFIPGAGLKVAGAALATAASYCVGGFFMFLMYYRNPQLTPRGRRLKYDPSLAGRCLRIAFPVALERVSACLGQVVFTSLVTRLGTLSLATHSIAITAEQAFYIPGYGMQAAASTLAGNSLGEGDPRKFRKVTGIIAFFAVLMMTASGALLFLFPGPLMSIFTTDGEVIARGISVLRIVAVSEPMFAALIILEGVFNGIGDTKVPFFFSIVSMWGVRILGTCFCLFVLHGGLESVWICMICDNITRCLLLSLRFFSGSWKRRFQDESAHTP